MDNIKFSADDRLPTELHPKGAVKAVCVDVVDLGLTKNPFYGKDPAKPGTELVHKIRIHWETEKTKSTGKRFVISKTYKLSLYAGKGKSGANKATLYKDLTSWFGEPITVFPPSEAFKDKAATLLITHEPGADGTVYNKIVSVDPDDDMDVLTPSGDYVRYVAKESAA